MRRTAYSGSRTAERVDFITAAPSLTEFGIVLRSYTLTSVTFVALVSVSVLPYSLNEMS